MLDNRKRLLMTVLSGYHGEDLEELIYDISTEWSGNRDKLYDFVLECMIEDREDSLRYVQIDDLLNHLGDVVIPADTLFLDDDLDATSIVISDGMSEVPKVLDSIETHRNRCTIMDNEVTYHDTRSGGRLIIPTSGHWRKDLYMLSVCNVIATMIFEIAEIRIVVCLRTESNARAIAVNRYRVMAPALAVIKECNLADWRIIRI